MPCAALLSEKIAHFQIGNEYVPFFSSDENLFAPLQYKG
jgi:hypothetical protein